MYTYNHVSQSVVNGQAGQSGLFLHRVVMGNVASVLDAACTSNTSSTLPILFSFSLSLRRLDSLC
jgi:hypothetical protein